MQHFFIQRMTFMIGKSLADLRIFNRAALLKLLYYNAEARLSRKEIASRLNLTQAAVSHIVKDMLEEGILIERGTVEDTRLGRREIMLDIDLTKFLVMSAYIPTRDICISCIDLAGNVHFEKMVHYDPLMTGAEIVSAVCAEMVEYIDTLPEERKKYVIGAGFGIKGICNNEKGVSVTSFGLWEDNLPVRKIAQECLGGLNVLIDNDIRCIAGAEMLFRPNRDYQSMLFVKYGPLVGGGFLLEGELFRGYSFSAMELGHVVVDPLGSICRCGKRGCLETVAGFDVIKNTAQLHYSCTRTPILYKITNGNADSITYDDIMYCYDNDEELVVKVLDGALDCFALMLVNAIGLVNPEKVMLYGFPFESERLLSTLIEKLSRLSHNKLSADVLKSGRNMQLDSLGCAAIVFIDFFEKGAIYTEQEQ